MRPDVPFVLCGELEIGFLGLFGFVLLFEAVSLEKFVVKVRFFVGEGSEEQIGFCKLFLMEKQETPQVLGCVGVGGLVLESLEEFCCLLGLVSLEGEISRMKEGFLPDERGHLRRAEGMEKSLCELLLFGEELVGEDRKLKPSLGGVGLFSQEGAKGLCGLEWVSEFQLELSLQK